jgi:hypothetical protein
VQAKAAVDCAVGAAHDAGDGPQQARQSRPRPPRGQPARPPARLTEACLHADLAGVSLRDSASSSSTTSPASNSPERSLSAGERFLQALHFPLVAHPLAALLAGCAAPVTVPQ